MGKENDEVVVQRQTAIPILDNHFGDSDLLPVISVKYAMVSLTWLFRTRPWSYGMKTDM